MFITLIIFIFILGLLVFVHEFGHFWVAKRVGVKVHEFAFGFKPRLVSWKRGGTEYAINAIPLGGYVKLEGESEDSGKAGSFLAQSVGKRALILIAGVLMNLVLAWLLLTMSYIIGSYPLSMTYHKHPGVINEGGVIVVDVKPNSPAETAGIQSGDAILEINGEPITETQTVTDRIKELSGQEITVKLLRKDMKFDTKATPRVNPPMGEGALGIGTGVSIHSRALWYKAPYVALLELGSEIQSAFIGFIGFVQQLVVKQEVNKDVSGIVGIGAATGIVRRLGIGPLLAFTALISTNLAVINILPFLPLDGGHLLFVGLEALRRKPVAQMYRQWFSMAGLAAIMLLFVIVTYQDVLNFALVDRIKQLFS
jgi:regulator of sigma E protease